ncbi:MAG: prkC 3 [Planctomycetaceae bacterium]|nr:prkC 3 [Planctomycetaceae bacterium]
MNENCLSPPWKLLIPRRGRHFSTQLPEQALGKKLDQRADLFSFGRVLYQMVSGRPPFRASSTLAVLKRLTEETPRPIREIISETPQWLCDIITKLHAKNPDERFQSAQEVADVLANGATQLTTHSGVKDFSLIPRTKTQPASWWKWAAVMAILFSLMAVWLLTPVTKAGLNTAVDQHPAHSLTTEPNNSGKSGPEVVPTQVKNGDVAVVDGWTQLFNGKDLAGWKTHPNQPGEWIVKDGVLVGSTFPSYLFSERGSFENFHLRIEAKINGGGDSGIFVRSPFAMRPGRLPGSLRPAGGYEVELHRSPIHATPPGSVWNAESASAAPQLLWKTSDNTLIRDDEWFVLEIIAYGNHFITNVNGTLTADCADPVSKFHSGHFPLQVLNAQTIVQFRKIEIRELPTSSTPTTFKNSIGMEFVIVPRGKSWLGGENGKLGDKEVEIPADFYLVSTRSRRMSGLRSWVRIPVISLATARARTW